MKSIVNDRRVPSPSTISKIAEYFHIDESLLIKAAAETEKRIGESDIPKRQNREVKQHFP